jgi:hypothetical protein
MGGLASWEAIASEIWTDDPDRLLLRRKWDRNLQTLRRHLRDAEMRPDLVRADGKGNFELVLLADDEVEDEV